MRKGLGKGLGMGYKNIVPVDPQIHSLSAKGIKSQVMLNAKSRKSRTPICTCEDYPCCGHSEEQRRMTQEEWDAMINRKVRRAMDYDDYDDEIYAKGKKKTLYAKNFREMTDNEFFSYLDLHKPENTTLLENIRLDRELKRRHNENISDYKRRGDIEGLKRYLKDYNVSYQMSRRGIQTYAKGTKLNAKITSIKSDASKEVIVDGLKNALKKKGYDANITIEGSHIKYSDVRLSDKYLDEKGYNVSSWSGRRGRYLGWDNWVEVNNTINDVLDKYNTSANVKTLGGQFVVREGKQRKTEFDWENRAYDNVGSVMRPVQRQDNWTPEGIPRKEMKKRGYGYYVPKKVKEKYGV